MRLQVSDELIKDAEQDFHDYLMEEEAHRIFNKAIDSLPNQMRAVINYSLDGLKNAEIAEKMNLTEGTVHAYKKEAYKKLKISLRECYYLLSVFVYLFSE